MKCVTVLAPVVFATATLASSVAAQVSVSVGPDPAPLGSPVFASVTNDTGLIMGIGGCPWRVFDEGGGLVFDATCLVQEFLIGPLGTINYRWNQVDQEGNPVPPGLYTMEVLTPGGRFLVPFQVGGTDANLHLKGTPAIGTNVIGFGGRQVAVTSPLDPGRPYRVAASFASAPGIPTCGGIVPLADDALFRASLRGSVVANASGTLNGNGYSESALLPVPNEPALVGIDFVLAFVVLDPGAPCIVRRISEPLPLTIAPGAIFPGATRNGEGIAR